MSQAPAERVDCVVIGAGVVGLAVARALAMAGREVLILEAQNAIGTQTSARNSEVIHAGIYYAPGSLKATLCVRGKALLYDYCAQRNVPHSRCGKLIVAANETQVAQLQAIRANAEANGVNDLLLLSAAEARAMEPALRCKAALHSPSTGIVDSHALMLSLLADLEHAGGVLACNSPLERAEIAQEAITLVAEDGTRLAANTVVNAAGHNAPLLAARFAGLAARHVPTPYYAKGNYFTLAGRAPFSRLVYPVPEAAGLGVHLTLDLGGQAKFGPDVQWVDSPDDLVVDPQRGNAFYAEVRKYWPDLPDVALQPAYAGMRPKISGSADPAADFCIQGPKDHGVAGLVNLFGIESPGLTSALAIAEHVVGLYRRQFSNKRGAENGLSDHEAPVNRSAPHAELIATFRSAEADAAHKFGLIKAVANKGPKAIQAAVDTAAKAAKRRDAYAKKLSALGGVLKD